MAEERRLCYVGMTRARSQLVLTGAARRRVFGEYQSMEPSRFMDEVPPQLVERIEPTYPQAAIKARSAAVRAFECVRCRLGQAANSTYHRAPGSSPKAARRTGVFVRGRRSIVAPRPQARRESPSPAVRRRNDLSVEELADDVKLVVRFSVGPKTLRAKYAKLEMADEIGIRDRGIAQGLNVIRVADLTQTPNPNH